MQCMKLLGIYREQIYSPGKIQEDAAILDATLNELSFPNYSTRALPAESLDGSPNDSNCIVSMAQSNRALTILDNWQKRGIRVINSVQSVRNCYRTSLIHLLCDAKIPLPPSKILPLNEVEKDLFFRRSARYWLKRGDVHAMQPEDVVKVASKKELVSALDHFRNRNIREVLVQEHVDGLVIKFYGIGASEYFCAFIASNGNEITSPVKQLSHLARLSAEAVGLEIYGGDAVLVPGEKFVLIDLNDWPSFSRCCQPAAKSIARYITRVWKGAYNEMSSCS
jgi:glutathione synthase/RimK-type ligase-like ATP-grasp enzyme